MRNRSETDSNPGSPTDQSGKPSGGKRFHIKLPKLRRHPKGHSSPNSAPDVIDTPSVEVFTFEQNLERRWLCEAGQQLIEREERLFGEINQTGALLGQEEETSRLAEDRKALVSLVEQTLTRSLGPERESAAVLPSAVRAVCQEEEQDRRWTGKAQNPPPWRPSCWRRLHDSAVQRAVEERMDNAPVPDGLRERPSIQQDFCRMGRQMKEDLLRVVAVVNGCYPPEMDICNLYARLYHQVFSSRLRKIADFGLDDRDCTSILSWVNDYYPSIFQKQELVKDIDYAALGKLLPEELSGPLEDQYLTNTEVQVQVCVDQVLEEAQQAWKSGVQPENRDGCFFSPLAIDVVQFISSAVKLAVIVLGDQQKAQTIGRLLKDFLQSFKKFQEDVMKGASGNNRPVVMANLVCAEQFRDSIVKKRDLFPEDVRESCLSVVTDMKQSGYTYLLSPVHKKLKPQYQTLGTSDWLKKPLFEDLLDSVKDHIEDLQGLNESCHQELMGQLQQDMTVEYVARLLRGKVKLKDKEMQENAARTVKENGHRLHQLFAKAGSGEDWLNDVLPKIAEVLQLQDLPSMQIEVVSLGTAYPDLSDKHVSALLKLKTNLSSADRKKVKATLLDSLAEAREGFQPFFSRVQIKYELNPLSKYKLLY